MRAAATKESTEAEKGLTIAIFDSQGLSVTAQTAFVAKDEHLWTVRVVECLYEDATNGSVMIRPRDNIIMISSFYGPFPYLRFSSSTSPSKTPSSEGLAPTTNAASTRYQTRIAFCDWLDGHSDIISHARTANVDNGASMRQSHACHACMHASWGI